MDKLMYYKEIDRRFESLRNKTDVKVSLEEETWEFVGLNALYISHKGAHLVNEGHGVQNFVSFNDGYLFAHGWHEPDRHGDKRLWGKKNIVPMPVYHILSIFERMGFPLTTPEWMRGQVWVGYPDMFSGYDKLGKPTFGLLDCEVFIIDSRGDVRFKVFKHEGKFSRFKDDIVTHWTEIGCQKIGFCPRTGEVYYDGKLYDPLEYIEFDSSFVRIYKQQIDNFLSPQGYEFVQEGCSCYWTVVKREN